jgi:hypothetical protein
MSEHSYRRAVTEINARGWRTQEPLDEGNAEEPLLLSKAISLAAEYGASVEDIASQTRLPLETVKLLAAIDGRPKVEL